MENKGVVALYHYFYGPALIPYFSHTHNPQRSPDFSERQRRREITLNVDGFVPPSSTEDLGDGFFLTHGRTNRSSIQVNT